MSALPLSLVALFGFWVVHVHGVLVVSAYVFTFLVLLKAQELISSEERFTWAPIYSGLSKLYQSFSYSDKILGQRIFFERNRVWTYLRSCRGTLSSSSPFA